MKKFAKIIAGWLAFLFLIAGTSQAYAQPIPISGCTIITQPGSYIVTNNIAASPFNVQNLPGGGVTCIGIAADFVTLDLGGFTITAFNLPATPFEQAIRTDFVDRKGIKVHSGTVANFSGAAVFLIGLGHTVEHIRAVNNHGGIVVTSLGGPGTNGHRIIGNTVLSNTMGGIEVGALLWWWGTSPLEMEMGHLVNRFLRYHRQRLLVRAPTQRTFRTYLSPTFRGSSTPTPS